MATEHSFEMDHMQGHVSNGQKGQHCPYLEAPEKRILPEFLGGRRIEKTL